MMSTFRRALPALIVISAVSAHAQYLKAHGASLSVGGTGQFTTPLETDPGYRSYTQGTSTTTLFNQQQFTTWSAGFVSSFQLHPVPFAGVAINYGFNHYQERYQYQYAGSNAPGQTRVTTDSHEFTAGYLVHPKHIPFQPYVEVGGGSIYFAPWTGNSQWRAAGLLETGFDLAPKNSRIGFRISGRSLYYRAPDFNSWAMSSRSWRVTTEPAVSAFYRF